MSKKTKPIIPAPVIQFTSLREKSWLHMPAVEERRKARTLDMLKNNIRKYGLDVDPEELFARIEALEPGETIGIELPVKPRWRGIAKSRVNSFPTSP